MTAFGSAAAWYSGDDLAQGLAAMMRRERDHRRRAADRGGETVALKNRRRT